MHFLWMNVIMLFRSHKVYSFTKISTSIVTLSHFTRGSTWVVGTPWGKQTTTSSSTDMMSTQHNTNVSPPTHETKPGKGEWTRGGGGKGHTHTQWWTSLERVNKQAPPRINKTCCCCLAILSFLFGNNQQPWANLHKKVTRQNLNRPRLSSQPPDIAKRERGRVRIKNSEVRASCNEG